MDVEFFYDEKVAEVLSGYDDDMDENFMEEDVELKDVVGDLFKFFLFFSGFCSFFSSFVIFSIVVLEN